MKRAEAVVAIFMAVFAPLAAVVFAVRHPQAVIAVVGGAAVAAGFGWVALTRRGALRVAATILAVGGLAAILIALLVSLSGSDSILAAVVVLALLGLAVLSGGAALRTGGGAGKGPGAAEFISAIRPQHAVLLMNPKSGGGKVERFGLVEEARKRGVEPVVLSLHDDFRQKALDAVAAGADALGAAGGDGTQAIVATVAIEHDLPFVCIPAGTRNHLALDLGIDRNDVVGALDAFVDGLEGPVDVGMVNDRLFVNNVSLGVYGEIVQSDAYRDAKVQTALDALPDLLGPEGRARDLRFSGPDGKAATTKQLVLVSNNPYLIDRLGGFGTRPRMDTGQLGIVSVSVSNATEAAEFAVLQTAGRIRSFAGMHEWAAPAFQVDADGPVAAGIDGEFVDLDPPVRFWIRPAALRVRIPRAAPGASPAATAFRFDRQTLRSLWAIAVHGA